MNNYYYYMRVSTAGQNLARQYDILDITKETANTFIDKNTGTVENENLTKLISELENNKDVKKTLYISSMDRLARNLTLLNELVEKIINTNTVIIFKSGALADTPISQDNGTSVGQLILNIFGAFAQFEREQIRERQAQGIKKWKQDTTKFINGIKIETYNKYQETNKLINDNNLSILQAIKLTGLSRANYYKIKNKLENDNES